MAWTSRPGGGRMDGWREQPHWTHDDDLLCDFLKHVCACVKREFVWRAGWMGYFSDWGN